MSKLITIYNPDGVAAKHSIPNARDLVNGAGWSYAPTRESSPAEFLPAKASLSALERQQLNAKPISQEIFDRYGSSATEDLILPTDKEGNEAEAEEATVEDTEDRVIPAYNPDAPEFNTAPEADEEGSEETPEAPAPRKRGRPSRV